MPPSIPGYVLDSWSIADGLPSGTIRDILQTGDGYLWLATHSGLVRFDGVRFVVFDRASGDLPDNHVNTLLEDPLGGLWVGLNRSGLHRWHQGEWQRFEPADSDQAQQAVRKLALDERGQLWVATDSGLATLVGNRLKPHAAAGCPQTKVLDLAATAQGISLLTNDGLWSITKGRCQRVWPREANTKSPKAGAWQKLLVDPEGELWLAHQDGNVVATGAPEKRLLVSGLMMSTATPARSLIADSRGQFWLGTDRGLERLGPESRVLSTEQGLADDRVWSLYEDREGSLWIGTYSGLNRLKPSRFSTLGSDAGLSHEAVFSFAERDASLWTGHGEGVDQILGLDSPVRAGLAFSQPAQVRTLLADSQGWLWAGSSRGLVRWRQQELESVTTSPWLDGVRALHEDQDGNIWVGGSTRASTQVENGGGVVRISPQGQVEPMAKTETQVTVIHQDGQGGLWLGTENGLLHLVDGQLSRPNSAAPNTYHVRDLYLDAQGKLWIGTLGNGLIHYADDQFVAIDTASGLYDDFVWHVLEDDDGLFWMCSDRGIFTVPRLELEAYAHGRDPRPPVSSTIYGHADGMRHLECNGGGQPGAIRLTSGQLAFPTMGGAVFVDPAQLAKNPVLPPVRIETVTVDGKVLQSDSVTLPADARQLEIHFTALSLLDPSRVRFRYRMAGYDTAWTEGTRRWAMYGNLPPGNYQFSVTASNNDGIWNPAPVSLAISVPTPMWRTWWASGLYLVALGSLGLLYYRRQQRRLRQERQRRLEDVRRERQANRRLREVDYLKDEFLAKTSQELRTPLFGITGLAQALLDGATGELPEATRSNLTTIVASGRRLGHLVNDILDYSKLRRGSLELNRASIDLHPLADIVLTHWDAYQGATEGLELINQIDPNLPPVLADENRLQQILHHLVDNAIRFTDHGAIRLNAEVRSPFLIVHVSDTGVGIPTADQSRIFGIFEQEDADAKRRRGGAGLGLTLTRSLVEIHGGEIWVESMPGKGSKFSFSLELARDGIPAIEDSRATFGGDCRATFGGESRIASSDDKRVASSEHSKSRLQAMAAVTDSSDDSSRDGGPSRSGSHSSGTWTGTIPSNPTQHRLLVVDDEPVNRLVLLHQLSIEGYDVAEAVNGREAIRRVAEEDFHLVLLDVMMPGLSGYEVCRSLRRMHSAYELPVIFLTAKDQSSDLVTGLTVGGNDYLTKPASQAELLARVRMHLDLAEAHHHLSRLVEERSEQVKVLSGLLPICASCKKIRDDEGYWQEVESYLGKHAAIELSHGLCPGCLEDLYPEFDLDSKS